MLKEIFATGKIVVLSGHKFREELLNLLMDTIQKAGLDLNRVRVEGNSRQIFAATPTPGANSAELAPAPAEPPADEIAESSVPAISGPAPLPRRKPMQTASVRARTTEPPLPRPRPDGPAPQSVWTAVPSSDDRYQAGQ